MHPWTSRCNRGVGRAWPPTPPTPFSHKAKHPPSQWCGAPKALVFPHTPQRGCPPLGAGWTVWCNDETTWQLELQHPLLLPGSSKTIPSPLPTMELQQPMQFPKSSVSTRDLLLSEQSRRPPIQRATCPEQFKDLLRSKQPMAPTKQPHTTSCQLLVRERFNMLLRSTGNRPNPGRYTCCTRALACAQCDAGRGCHNYFTD